MFLIVFLINLLNKSLYQYPLIQPFYLTLREKNHDLSISFNRK